MSKFLILLRKEVKSLITVQNVAPLVMIFVLFYVMGSLMGSLVSEGDAGAVYTNPGEDFNGFENNGIVYSQTSIIGFIDRDNTDLSRYVKSNLMYLDHNPYNGIIPIGEDELGASDPEEAMRKLKDYVYIDDLSDWDEKTQSVVVTPNGVEWTTQTLLVIPKGFEANLLAGKSAAVDIYSSIDSFGLTAMMTGVSSYNVVEAVNGILSQKLYEDYGGDSSVNINFLKFPVYANDYTYLNDTAENIPAASVLGYVTSQLTFVPIIIMLIILMAATMIAVSMVTEKADKTLETLMTTPISRMSVLLAKIFSAAIYAIVYAAVFIFAFQNFNDSLNTGGTLSDEFLKAVENFGIAFDAATFLIIGVQLFLSVLCGLAIALIIGMMVEDVKALQSYIMPLMIFIMIPYFLTMFLDINTLPLIGKIALYIIPFTHTFTAAINLFAGNYALIAFGIAYQALFVGVMLTLAVRIFNSDKLFTLGQILQKKPKNNKNKKNNSPFGKLFSE